MSRDVFGWELHVSFRPEFFEDTYRDFDFGGDSNVVHCDGQRRRRRADRGQRDSRFRPYSLPGLGMLQVEAQGATATCSISKTSSSASTWALMRWDSSATVSREARCVL